MSATAYPLPGNAGIPARLALRIARRLPPVVLEQPWALLIKTACVVTGVTTWIGPAPGSIAATFPVLVQWAWSATLVLGAVAALAGLLRPTLRNTELAGLIWLGTASLVYGLAVLMRFQWEGAVPGGMVLAFGLAALLRALAVYVTWVIARAAAAPPPANTHRRRR